MRNTSRQRGSGVCSSEQRRRLIGSERLRADPAHAPPRDIPPRVDEAAGRRDRGISPRTRFLVVEVASTGSIPGTTMMLSHGAIAAAAAVAIVAVVVVVVAAQKGKIRKQRNSAAITNPSRIGSAERKREREIET